MNVQELAVRLHELQRDQWQVLHLDGAAIRSRAEFSAALVELCPMDPPVHSLNWDGLTDSLFGGLDTLRGAKLVLLWTSANRLREADAPVCAMAEEVLTDVAQHLNDERDEDAPRLIVVRTDHSMDQLLECGLKVKSEPR